MNELEVSKFLTFVSAIDNRIVEPETVLAWQPILATYTLDDSISAAQMHFAESIEYLMPAHITSNIRRVINERIRREERAALGMDVPDEGVPKPDNFDAMIAAHANPAEFSRQVAIYNRQLVDAGFKPNTSYPIAPRRQPAHPSAETGGWVTADFVEDDSAEG